MKTILKLTIILFICTPVVFAKTNSVDASVEPSRTNPAQTKVKKHIEPSFSRGQLLYENHCTTCHASQVHIRSNRKAHSIKDVRHWVIHWNRELQLKWNNQDVNEVSRYISEKFYKF